MERRLAGALAAFGSGGAACAHRPGIALAQRGKGHSQTPRGQTLLQPARTPQGRLVLFDGWFDNLPEIAAALGCDPASEPALVYGLACERWGDAAETRVIGHYAAILADAEAATMRLSRSAPAAPPLHYCQLPAAAGGGIAAASVPNALLAAGLERRLNERKLVDSMFVNTTEDEGFLAGTFRVAPGQIVHLSQDRRVAVQTFDPLAIRPASRGTLQDYVEEADRLLEEAGRCAIAGFDRPGIQLSGGLDSGNVAARVLRSLEPGQTLPSFTFTPLGGDPGLSPEYFFGDERPAVEAFAAMHPRIEPHFTDNADVAFDSELDRMFMAMGTAPPNLAITSGFAGLFRLAGQKGCDLLLSSDLGNFTISNSGVWGYAEYFRHLKWGKLLTALRNCPHDRPMHRNFLSLSVVPHLPDAMLQRWQRWRGAIGKDDSSINDSMAFVRSDVLERHDIVKRARDAGVLYERTRHAWRSDMVRDQWARGDVDSADTLMGFRQLYGVHWRDVTAWRPLVEFCLSLPTEAFLGNGQSRQLARELAKGIMPEAQRRERRYGFQQADWHRRLTPRVPELRAEVERARGIAEIADLIDLDALARTLDEWPEQATLDYAVFTPCALGVPRAITAIRYIRFVSGHNQG